MAKTVTPESKVLNFIKSKKIKFVDLKFMDFPGQWQHFTVPVSQFDKDSFVDGYGFDGSSIRGWKKINERDFGKVDNNFHASFNVSSICLSSSYP